MTQSAFKGWAILELMGHRKRPGFVEEVEIAGGKMLRVDIHGEGDTVVTEFYGSGAIYCLRPVSEEIARDSGSYLDLRPPRPVAYRDAPALTASRRINEDDDDGDDSDGMPF